MLAKTLWIFVVAAILQLTSASVISKLSHDGTMNPLEKLDQGKSQDATLEHFSPPADLLSRKPRRAPARKPKSQPTANFTDATIAETVKFMKQHPLKPITDLIAYGMKKDMIESRTGLMLFGAITAVEIFTVTTAVLGIGGLAIAGLIAMVNFLLAGSVIMIG